MRKGLSIRTLLIGAHAFVWLAPLTVIALLQVYDVYLLRQTEHQLVAESVLTGEAFRDAYLRALGRTTDHHLPPGASGFAPIDARVDFDSDVLPPGPSAYPKGPLLDDAARRAGAAVESLLHRAQSFNLSGVRILDTRGCVVASSRGQTGECMPALPEVKRALDGHYDAALRERVSDEPAPPLGDIRRRGRVRVFVALPVFSDGKVIAVVRASRTGLDAISSLWANRRGIVWLVLLTLTALGLIALTSATAIVRPLRRLTRAAQAVARGESAQELSFEGTAPREIAELSQVLRSMAEELEARAGYVRAFASEVSHELKTPITAIRGAAELLHQEVDMPEADRVRFLSNIEEDARRMERLVTRLLELARAENRAASVDADPIDAVALIRSLCERGGDRVRLSAPNRYMLAMPPEELETVVHNLLDNALRHGAPEAVDVSVRAESDRLCIAITDRGPPISEANQKRLFERFFTTERDRGGTGLGLAIVKAIVEARGGSVHVHVGAHGTTFSARI